MGPRSEHLEKTPAWSVGAIPGDEAMNQRRSAPEKEGATGTRGADAPRFLDVRRIRSLDEAYGGFHTRISGEPLNVLRRRIWVFFAVFMTIFTLVAAYTFGSTKYYRSSATLELAVEQPGPLDRLGDAMGLPAQFQQKDYFETQAGILKSRTLAEALADKLDLARSPEFAADTSPVARVIGAILGVFSSSGPADEAPPQELARRLAQERLIDQVLGRLTVKRIQRSNLMLVSMEARDRVFGKKMLDSLLELYLQRHLQKRRKTNVDALIWLKSEVEKSEKKLLDSVASLVKFAQEHGMVSLEDQSNHLIGFFNKTAEGLVRTKERRVQAEAFQREGAERGLPIIPQDMRTTNYVGLKEKLSLLEAELAQLREIYSEDYPRLVMLRKQVEFLKGKIAETEKDMAFEALETAKKEEKLQEEAFEKAKRDAMASNSLGVQYAILKKEQETDETLYKMLLTKHRELELSTRIIGTNILVVDAPTLENNPSRPRTVLNLALGVLAALIGGILAAFYREATDTRLRGASSLERALSLHPLGVVPYARSGLGRDAIRFRNVPVELLAYDAPACPASDAVRNIKASLMLSRSNSKLKRLVVTSPGPGQGKTFLAVSLASVCASQVKRALLLEADLRRPRIDAIFGRSGVQVGLTDLIAAPELDWRRVLAKSRIPGLYYLSAGKIPPNPVELLESDRFTRLLKEFGEVFDVTIVDTPPLVGFADTPVVAAKTDGAILTVKDGDTQAELLRSAVNALSVTGVELLGVVLNLASPREGGRYYYQSRYYGRSRPRSADHNAEGPRDGADEGRKAAR
jgi:capsular exopolysaccharide synthesis family protein